MDKKIIVGLALAALAAAIAGILLTTKPTTTTTPQAVGELTTKPGTTTTNVYTYQMKLESGQTVQQLVQFVKTPEGIVYIDQRDNDKVYIMFKTDGVVNIYSETPETIQRFTYYSRVLELCINSTTTATIAGEKITLSRSECTPSLNPLPTAKTIDEVIFLLQGLPTPNWQRAGTAQTPMGPAVLYANTTVVPVMPGLSAVFNYEKTVLKDGTPYSIKISLAYGAQTVAILTYTLQNITKATPAVEAIVRQITQNTAATTDGGLDILRVAEKIGMSLGSGWPAAVVFYDLHCPYCALLFKYNYTLFENHKLVLVDLLIHPEAAADHEKLRCIYDRDPAQVVPTLRILYDRLLAGERNYTDLLPAERCYVDFDSASRLASLLAGGSVGTPMTVVIYPNGTYTVVHGYDPNNIAKALGR
ncbi:MAG: hypothetical protein QXK71_06760 [Pyrobaculum sp.]